MTQRDRFHGTYIGDHLPSGLISLSVVGPFLFLLQNPFPGGAILQCKLANDPAEFVYVHFPNCIRRVTHEEQKGMEPAMKNPIAVMTSVLRNKNQLLENFQQETNQAGIGLHFWGSGAAGSS